MKNLKFGTNFAIFIIFFGVAALEAVQTQNWLRIIFWLAIGVIFLWADVKKMRKICDHKSVGMLVWKDDSLLLIERARFPFGFAIPAGHVDGDPTYEESAKRELKEEVGLETKELKLIVEGRKENHCRRDGGTWHYWKIYQIITTGDINRSKDETKQSGWYTKEQIKELGTKTEKYNNKEISEEEWEESPGLEPVMYEWFKELKII